MLVKKVFNILSLLTIGIMAISHNEMAYAAVTCDLIPTHISGSITIRLTRYGINYPISRGELVIQNASPIQISNCLGGYLGRVGPRRIKFKSTLESVSDNAGNPAFNITMQSQSNKLAVAPRLLDALVSTGYMSQYLLNDTTYLVTEPQSAEGSPPPTSTLSTSIDIVNIGNWALPASAGSETYTIAQPVGSMSLAVRETASSSLGNLSWTPYYDAIYLDNLTVNYIVSSCGINSKQGSIVSWSNLTKANLRLGNVETKPYSLSLICGLASDPASPVNISFSSNYGFADATDDTVKTNLNSVGIQLSWANPALPPLKLGEVNHSTLSGVGDYAVLAKPVKIGGDTDMITAGTFDTIVTMNIEFP